MEGSCRTLMLSIFFQIPMVAVGLNLFLVSNGHEREGNL